MYIIYIWYPPRDLPFYLYFVKLLCWLWSWGEGVPQICPDSVYIYIYTHICIYRCIIYVYICIGVCFVQGFMPCHFRPHGYLAGPRRLDQSRSPRVQTHSHQPQGYGCFCWIHFGVYISHGPLSGSPYNQDHHISGSILGPLTYGNSHFLWLVQDPLPWLRQVVAMHLRETAKLDWILCQGLHRRINIRWPLYS